MEDLIKKVLYTGVGLVATATEKMQSTVDDLVDKEKIDKEEGKKIVDEFVESTESKKGELESRLNEMVEGVIDKLNLAKKSEVETLKQRIEELEKQLNNA